MEKISVKNAHVIRMNGKSLTFEINGSFYFATKRVANEILTGQVEEAYVIQKEMTGCGINTWLATPSIF